MDVEQFRDDVRCGRVDADRLVDLVVTLNGRLQQADERLQRANERISELERKLAGRGGEKIAEPFSLAAEEKRQQARGRARRKRNRPLRRGRIRTADKLALAVRTEQVFPAGVLSGHVDERDCKHSHTRCVWRLENGTAALVAYEIYRGPRNQYGKIPGVIGRGEFGLEIVLAIAYQVYVAELPKREGPADDYRLLCNELMRLMVHRQLFTFVAAPPVTTPSGETTPVAGTNNEAERTLRGPALARKTGRTNKTPRGARRQTIVVSVLESLRQQLSTFTLSGVIREVLAWSDAGQSCFQRLLAPLRLNSPAKSILDSLLPAPSG